MPKSQFRTPSTLESVVEEFGNLRADYSAAKDSRFKRKRYGLLPYGSGNDWSLRVPTDYYSILEQVRDMIRNDVLIGQMVERAAENILGEGPRPDPQTGDRGFNRHLRDRWADYSSDPQQVDAGGELDFDGQTFLATVAMLGDGDIFGLGLRDGQVQLVEGHRCRSISGVRDNLALGVELDKSRKAVAYHFVPDSIAPMDSGYQLGEGKRYPARDADGERVVFHLLDRRRASQTRGMSALTPCVDTGGMVDDLVFSTLVQSQVQSCYSIIHELDPTADATGPLSPTGGTSTTLNSDGTSNTTEGLSPGARIQGKPGEKIKGFSPAVPGQNYFPHIKLLVGFISVNLGMPLILALLDASETNFSAWRGALEQARQGFRRKQRVLRSCWLRPIYRFKVRQWLSEDPIAQVLIDQGKIRDPLAHKWNRPAFPYIDPLKDAQSDSHRLENGLVSPRRLFHEQGQEWAEHIVETIDDLTYAIVRALKRAQQINKQFPENPTPIGWRDLVYLPMAAGTRVDVRAQSGAGFGDDDSADDAENGDAGKNRPRIKRQASGKKKGAKA